MSDLVKLVKTEIGYGFVSPDGDWRIEGIGFEPGAEPSWFRGYPYNWALWGEKDLVAPTESFKTLGEVRVWLTEKYGPDPMAGPARVPLTDLLRHCIALERREPSPLADDAYKMPKMVVGDRKTRAQLKLLIVALRDTMLARHETIPMYRYTLRRIRRPSSRRSAFAVANRFFQIAEEAVADQGEAYGDRYVTAARIAEILGENYNGWPPSDALYDVAGMFISVVYPDVDTSVFRQLMVDLEALESPRRAAPGGGV